MDFSYSQQQLEIKRGIREWGKKHLTEEAIAAGYKNRGIAPEIAKAWVDVGWGMYGPARGVRWKARSTIRPWP